MIPPSETALGAQWYTCRMGSDGDPLAVTDNQSRVRGVAGLRVVDASLFPCVPCAQHQLPDPDDRQKIADTMVAP